MKKMHLFCSTLRRWHLLFVATLLVSTLHAPGATDTQPPTVTVLSTNVQFVRTPTFEIYGTAMDDIGLKTLKVLTGTAATGYSTLTNITLSGRSATWSVTVPLTEGLNYFLVQIIDASGKSACNLGAVSTHPSCGQIYAVFSTNAARTPFEAWQVANFTQTELLDPTVSGPDADPDHDGVKNFVEYTSGMNPKIANQHGLPTISLETPYLTMTYAKAKNATDATNMLWVSTNLSNWNTGPAYSTMVSTQDLGATLQFKARMTQAVTNSPIGFMRLDVQKSAPTVFGTTQTPQVPPSVALILANNCQSCHLPGGSSGIFFYDGDVYSNLIGIGAKTQENVPRVFPGFPEFSHLYGSVSSTDSAYRMPYQRPPLSPSEIEIIRKWIEDGALR